MKYMRLLEPSLIVPQQEQGRPYWMPQVLAAGTVVGLMKNNLPSVVTGRSDERYVRWVDVAGRVTAGWLPKTARLTRSTKKQFTHVSANKEDRLTSWDTLRNRVFMNQGWTMVKWLKQFGRQHTPLLHAVIRELGGQVPKSGDPSVAIVHTLKLVNAKEIHTMSKNTKKNRDADVEVTASKKASKKGGKKGSKKAVKREGGPGRTSMYSGKRIVKLVKDNPRREDTHGYNSWELLRKGMTYEEYIAAGGRRVDLAWDIAKGNVKLAKA